MYKLIIDKAAEKFVKKLDNKNRERIRDALLSLAENPYLVSNVKKLAGLEDTYRKRIGNIRIVYKIEDEHLIILVLKIGYRGGVYKD